MPFPMTYGRTQLSSTFVTSRRKVLLKKTLALVVLALLIFVVFMMIRHYFYILDSYYYSAEFHVNFLKNSLRNANIELLSDYFKSLRTIPGIFPMLLLGYIIQNFWIFFSKPVLVAAITSAVGLPHSLALNYIGLLLTGIISFLVGLFFLGDIVPLLFKKKVLRDESALEKSVVYGITGTLFALPIFPIIIPAFFSALIRIRSASVLIIMMSGFIIRLLLIVSLPNISAA